MTKISPLKQKQIIAIMVVVCILVCDQLIKYLVKTNMMLYHPIIWVENWAQLYFTENKGMAFGMDFFGTYALCLLRIVAVGFLCYYLHKVIKQNAPMGFVIAVAMVLAGAAGNIFDNVFYGMIFTESTEYSVASLVPFGEGYGQLFAGKVVDMFYFPIIDTYLPEWLPIKGGDHFVFFAPIFNFADSAITCGGFIVVLFYRKTFSKYFSNTETTKTEVDSEK